MMVLYEKDMVSPLFPVVSLSVDRPRRNKKFRFSKRVGFLGSFFLARADSLHRLSWFLNSFLQLRSTSLWFWYLVSSRPSLTSFPLPLVFRSLLRVRSNIGGLRALGRGFWVLRVLVYSLLCGFAVEIGAGPVFSEGCSPRSPRYRSVAE